MKVHSKTLVTSALASLFIATPQFAYAADNEWNPVVSMTPALRDTTNVWAVDPKAQLFGRSGPSPSNQALVVFPTEAGDLVLMCKDHDLRQDRDGGVRPTHGALKASFGFGLPEGHTFSSSFEALVRGPANTSLYGMFDGFPEEGISLPNLVYAEQSEGWGPAATIPMILTRVGGTRMSSDEVAAIVTQLNTSATAAFESRQEGDIFTGRFRDFVLVSLSALLEKGSDEPAVSDASKLQTLVLDGKEEKLWDEPQMRQNLLPHVAAYIAESIASLPAE